MRQFTARFAPQMLALPILNIRNLLAKFSLSGAFSEAGMLKFAAKTHF